MGDGGDEWGEESAGGGCQTSKAHIASVGPVESGEAQLFKLCPHRSWDQRVVPWGTNLAVIPLSLFDLLSPLSVAFFPVLTFSFRALYPPSR